MKNKKITVIYKQGKKITHSGFITPEKRKNYSVSHHSFDDEVNKYNTYFISPFYSQINENKYYSISDINSIKQKFKPIFENIQNSTVLQHKDTKNIIKPFIDCYLTLNNHFKQHNAQFMKQKQLQQQIKIQNVLSNLEYIDIKQSKDLFKEYSDYQNVQKLISQHNENYIKQEIKNNLELFRLEGYELDDDQKIAIITDEKSQLVIAGAGCGKTSMLIGKANYLIHKGVPAEKILILSYTKKTVNDMNERFKKLNIPCETKTFHSLAYSYANKRYNDNINIKNILAGIIRPQQTLQINIANDSQSLYKKAVNFIKSYLNNKIQSKQLDEIKRLFIKFVSNCVNKKDITEDTLLKYTIDDYLNQKFSTFKDLIEKYEKKNTTIKGEKVKSLGEVKIANFLFFNGITYEYEKEYTKKYYSNTTVENKNKHYNPDFYIKAPDGTDIWIEHFGVHYENGEPHAYWLKADHEIRYLKQMEEKRKTHHLNNTVLIETNSSQLSDRTIFEYLKQELEKYNIVFKKRTDTEIQKYIDVLIKSDADEKYTDYIERYINLFKSQSKFKSLEEIKKYVLNHYPYKFDEIHIFFELVDKLYALYEDILKNYESIDFNDMINDAINIIKSDQKTCNYDYILVDEYQDITQRRYDLLLSLQEKTQAKIFCVGDDWQSIYGFVASDISLFTHFDEMFPYSGELLKISKTYRNSDKLVEIAGNFIMKNESQKKKVFNIIRYI